MNTLIIFTDGSHRPKNGRAGAGFLATEGGQMLIGARPLANMETSTEAEAEAAVVALETCIDHFTPLQRVVIYSDCRNLVEGLQGTASTTIIKHSVASMHRMSALHGIALSAKWIKGHSRGLRPASDANQIAHALADIGREKGPLTRQFDFNRKWRETLMAFDPKLFLTGRPVWMEITEAAELLDLPSITVFELVKHGHLESEGYKVSRKSVDMVRRELLAMRRAQQDTDTFSAAAG